MTELSDSSDAAVSSDPLCGKTALVTGASRGIGASVARRLAAAGADVAVNYRTKGARAQAVAAAIEAFGRRSLLLQADITCPADLASMFDQIKNAWGSLDVLVLNASGGLEKDKPAGYAMQLNLDAQVNLVKRALPLMQPGGRIVFVTSHLAHFSETKPAYDGYEPVARSKKAGEDALRSMMPELDELGIRLVVVSGDLIEGTITPRLLQRQSPGLIEERRREAGSLPDVEEFAAAIVDAVTGAEYASGTTIYVGSTEWGDPDRGSPVSS
ncbi:MAG TPA: SDR family oxidoreductase [Bryobacteraceae bacterium]|jgi:NAD(P)-dependent dehydrogenase (short-subunit alcohol dehydrogenase family)|nr:SDR family oxidoreductase [Bryobacteraceae bacterium]